MNGCCHCKEVTFSSSQQIKAILNCHCGLCRKMNGSAFSTYVVVPSHEFSLTSGTLKTVKVSEHSTKSFCVSCGTPIYNQSTRYPGLTIIHYGALNDVSHLSPVLDTYCANQVPWIEKLSQIKKLEAGIG